jgi:hypothetical protein
MLLTKNILSNYAAIVLKNDDLKMILRFQTILKYNENTIPSIFIFLNFDLWNNFKNPQALFRNKSTLCMGWKWDSVMVMNVMKELLDDEYNNVKEWIINAYGFDFMSKCYNGKLFLHRDMLLVGNSGSQEWKSRDETREIKRNIYQQQQHRRIWNHNAKGVNIKVLECVVKISCSEYYDSQYCITTSITFSQNVRNIMENFYNIWKYCFLFTVGHIIMFHKATVFLNIT